MKIVLGIFHESLRVPATVMLNENEIYPLAMLKHAYNTKIVLHTFKIHFSDFMSLNIYLYYTTFYSYVPFPY